MTTHETFDESAVSLLGATETRLYDLATVAGIPPTITKSMVDDGDYALGLADGTLVRFRSSHLIDGNWLHVDQIPGYPSLTSPSHPFGRAMDVRISSIMWASEAPGES